MWNPNRRALHLALLFGLICSILCGMARFDAACDDLRDNVLRLHILANSDGAADQANKLRVRDALLAESADLFSDGMTLPEATAAVRAAIPRLEAAAVRALRASGCEQPVRLCLGRARFNTRVYEDFTLPAGEYDALRVEIGAAAGKNWWCVLFPAVCVGAASDRGADGALSDTVEPDGVRVAEQAPKYRVRFKIVEFYERLRGFFEGEREYRR